MGCCGLLGSLLIVCQWIIPSFPTFSTSKLQTADQFFLDQSEWLKTWICDSDDPKKNIISGWWFQPIWKIWKSMGRMISHILWKIKKCSKPPTSTWWWVGDLMMCSKWRDMNMMTKLSLDIRPYLGSFQTKLPLITYAKLCACACGQKDR